MNYRVYAINTKKAAIIFIMQIMTIIINSSITGIEKEIHILVGDIIVDNAISVDNQVVSLIGSEGRWKKMRGIKISSITSFQTLNENSGKSK